MLDILKSLGFDAKYDEEANLLVGVPPFRSEKDISIPEDIIEEVLRVYGYDNISPVLPAQPIKPLYLEKSMKLEHKMRRLLSGAHRFLEVHNYIWFNDSWLKTLAFEPGETLTLKNPTTPETTRLRTTLIPNLLTLVPKNRPYRDKFQLFEVGRTFHSIGKDRQCNEKHHLAGIAFRQSGNLEDFYLTVKSAVEDTLKSVGIADFRFVYIEESKVSWITPDTTVSVQIRGQSGFVTVGHLGVLDKAFMNKICPEGGLVSWFELDLDMLCGNSPEAISGTLFPQITFKEPPRYPLSWQDFSLVWPVDEGFEKLESQLDGFAHSLIVKREFLISYKGKGLEKGTASYSFRFWIGAEDHTLSGEEIENFHAQFLSYIKSQNIALRA